MHEIPSFRQVPSDPQRVKNLSFLSHQNEHVQATAEQARTWTVTSVGPTLHLSGECPACGHDSPNDVPVTVVELESTSAKSGGSLTIALRCSCIERHNGRPAGMAQGCGRSWEFIVMTWADGSKTVTPANDPILTAAAAALREEAPKQAHGLRASAEKWIGGIVTLYTLFGLASISVAKDSITSLPEAARITVGLLVLGALIGAAFAVYCAYRGAYGFPVVHQIANDQDLRKWYYQRSAVPGAIAALINRAVAMALASLAALGLAVGVIWFTTPEQPQAPVVRLTLEDDSKACGELLVVRTDTGSVVRLRRADDGSVLQVAAGSLKAITPVKAC